MKYAITVLFVSLCFLSCTTNEDRLEKINDLAYSGNYDDIRSLVDEINNSEPSEDEKKIADAWLLYLALLDDSTSFYETDDYEKIAEQIDRINEHQCALILTDHEPHDVYMNKIEKYKEIISGNIESKMHSIKNRAELDVFIKFIEESDYNFEIDSNNVINDINSLFNFIDTNGKQYNEAILLRTLDYLDDWVELKDKCAKILMKLGKEKYNEGEYEEAIKIFTLVMNISKDVNAAKDLGAYDWRAKAQNKRDEQKHKEEMEKIRSTQNSYTDGVEVGIAVTGAELRKYLGYQYTYGNTRFLLVSISVRNIGNERRFVGPNDFSVADQWGNTCSYDASTYSLTNTLDSTTLNPGNRTSGWLAFIVNKDSEYYELICDDTYGTFIIKRFVLTD